MRKLVAFAFFAVVTFPVWAQTKIVQLSVPGMTCGACPITVRTALKRVPGVKTIKIDEDKKVVTVAFDDTQTNVNALTKVTTNAGYPSTVKQ